MSVSVLSTLALKGTLEQFRGEFERALGEPLELRFDATRAILASRTPCDLLILTREAIESLADLRETRVLGSSGVGVAVRAGAPKPDIGSLEAFRKTIENAASVAHSKVGASGLYFSELVERLPLKLKKRVVVEKGPVGRVVAAGEAEIGVQQLCELAPVPGIDIVGGLPEPIQKLTHFAAGIPAAAANPRGARELLRLLQGDAVRAAMPRLGFAPT